MITEDGVFEEKNSSKNSTTVASLEDLAVFAERFLASLFKIQAGLLVKNDMDGMEYAENRALVVGLSGDLGAGKTAFSQRMAKLLGVGDVVNSPTFVIQKNYLTQNPVFKNFVHIDAYRLEGGEEIEKLKFRELLKTPETLIFIEWPEKVAEILPKNTIMLSFESIDENTRKISYYGVL